MQNFSHLSTFHSSQDTFSHKKSHKESLPDYGNAKKEHWPSNSVIALHCRYPSNNFSNLCASFFACLLFHITIQHASTPKKTLQWVMTSLTASFFTLYIRPCEYLGNIKLRLCDDYKTVLLFCLWTFTFSRDLRLTFFLLNNKLLFIVL